MSISSRRPDHRLDFSWLRQLESIDEALGYYRHLSSVSAFIDNQRLSRVTIAVVAQAIGISPNHLSRLFQEKLGVSFHDWLTLRRVREATRLLQARQISASQAAHVSGFASYRSFVRAFKDVIGITPTKYRKLIEEALLAHVRE
jgi:AraC-like DNA-binding protein